MNPSRIFILRPVATALLMVAVLLSGFVAYRELPLSALPEVQDGEFKVSEFALKTAAGPTSRITHRVILSGGDRPGLIAKTIRILDEHGARVVRMNAEKLIGSTGDQYIARFAISVRHGRAPACLSGIVALAGELGMTFRYETA